MPDCAVIVFGRKVRPFDDVEAFFMLSVDGDDDDFELLTVGDGIKL